MPHPWWEDLRIFFDPGDFGRVVELRLSDGASRTFAAIYEEPDASAEIGRHDAELTGPRIVARLADLQGARRGDVLVIPGLAAAGEAASDELDVLRGPQPDGTGLAMLPLARP